MATVSVLAIGSDRQWRTRLDRMLSGRSDVSWLGGRGANERRDAREQPDLLMVDGDDPGVGFELRCWRGPLPRLLYFHQVPTVRRLRACMQAGAKGCLDKAAAPETVWRAIRSVNAGLVAVAPTLLLRALMDTWGAEPRMPSAAAPGLMSLTDRQREIVRWAAQGLSNKQIARNLGISPETVKTHLHHVFERTGVSGRMALMAAQWGAPAGATADSTVDDQAGD